MYTSYVFIALAIIAVFVVFRTATVVPQQSAYVVENLGKYSRTLGAGFHILIPFVERVAYRHSLKEQALDVAEQICITKDNVQVAVDAVLYMQVLDPHLASYGITNYSFAIGQLAQTTLRSVLGEAELDELLSQRDKLNLRLQSILDRQTSAWGVKVVLVEMKQVDLAAQMIRTIARQAEAERERRAKIIHAEGEYTAAEKLSMAAEVLQHQPAAIQLRYLQTLVEIGTEKNTTIVFPLPVDIISSMARVFEVAGGRAEPGKIAE